MLGKQRDDPLFPPEGWEAMRWEDLRDAAEERYRKRLAGCDALDEPRNE